MLNPKQMNIAHGPQGQRWDDGMIKSDERWANQAERDLGPAYLADVAKTHAGESSHYYPGQGGPGTQTQGKLFHDPKPSDPVRWPRGYTPERQSDVEVTFATGRGGRKRVDPIANKSREAIARSDMPEKDLSALSGGFSGTKTVKIEELPPGSHFGGDFWDPGAAERSMMKGPGSEVGEAGTIRLGGKVSANTILHEVGHAVSYQRGKRRIDAWGDRGQPDAPGVMGAEEARADMYANAHARKRSGEPHQDWSDYDGERAYGYRGNELNQFESAYAREHMNEGQPRPSELFSENSRQHNARIDAGMRSPKLRPSDEHDDIREWTEAWTRTKR